MNWNAVWAIVRKDLKVVFQNKAVSIPLIVAPVAIMVALPVLAMLAPKLGGMFHAGSGEDVKCLGGLLLYHYPLTFNVLKFLYAFLSNYMDYGNILSGQGAHLAFFLALEGAGALIGVIQVIGGGDAQVGSAIHQPRQAFRSAGSRLHGDSYPKFFGDNLSQRDSHEVGGCAGRYSGPDLGFGPSRLG